MVRSLVMVSRFSLGVCKLMLLCVYIMKQMVLVWGGA
jgi:hypothetical protein